MDAQLLEELLKRDEEIAELNQMVFRLLKENDSMKRTIENILRVRCKRGEGAFAINIDLKDCVMKNVDYAFLNCIHERQKPLDIVVNMIVRLLVGESIVDIPCAVLDVNTVIYKDGNIVKASMIQEFAEMLHKTLQEPIQTNISTILSNTTDDTSVNVCNMILNLQSFVPCVKKALKIYKDY